MQQSRHARLGVVHALASCEGLETLDFTHVTAEERARATTWARQRDGRRAARGKTLPVRLRKRDELARRKGKGGQGQGGR